MSLLLVCICKFVIGSALLLPYLMRSVNQAVEYIRVFSLCLVIYCIRRNYPGKPSGLLWEHDTTNQVSAQESCKHYRINLAITIINLSQSCLGATVEIGNQAMWI